MSSSCAGTLVKSNPALFVTAAHCVNEDAALFSSLEVDWNYFETCSGSQLSGNYKRQHGGASVLAVDKNTDVALLRLNMKPLVSPASWTAVTQQSGENIGILHFPRGGTMRYTEGLLKGSCTPTVGDIDIYNGACSSDIISDASRYNFYAIDRKEDNPVEIGSSGGGVFNSKSELIGVVHGGSVATLGKSYCELDKKETTVGRFDLAYKNKLSQYFTSK
jgi:S1-C subfamily serine protease